MARPTVNIVFCAFLFLSFHSLSSAETLTAQTDGRVDKLDMQVTIALSEDNTSVHWPSYEYYKPGASFMMVHFSGFDDVASRDFEISIYDLSSEQYKINGNDIRENNVWSPVIYGPRVIIKISAKDHLEEIKFTLEAIAYQTSDVSINTLSIIEPNELEHVRDYSDNQDIMDVSNAVAKLSFVRDNELKVCTGFLISEDNLMTNEHCVESQDVCETTTAIFGFQKTAEGYVRGEKYKCEEYIKSNKSLDYSIIKLRGSPGRTWGTINLADITTTANQPVYIVQHPGGKAKRISIRDCSVVEVDVTGLDGKSDFSHKCDTKGGSSGSPVFSTNHKIIGLHHYGIDDNRVWAENRAVQINKIFEDL